MIIIRGYISCFIFIISNWVLKIIHIINKRDQTLDGFIAFLFVRWLIAVRKKPRNTRMDMLKPIDKQALSIVFSFLKSIWLNRYPGRNMANNNPRIILIVLSIILHQPKSVFLGFCL